MIFNPFNFLSAIIRIENPDTQHNRIENPIGQWDSALYTKYSLCV